MIKRNLVDYDFYKNEFKGDLIPSNDAFKQASNEAIEYLNYKLNDRVVVEPDTLNNCICAISERIYNMNNQYTSESLGSWSVTYSDYNKDSRMRETLISYLGRTGALCTWL